MIDMELFSKSLKCKWVKLYLDESLGGWKVFFDTALEHYGGKFLFDCNYKNIDVNISNEFIYEVCSAWSLFNFRPPNHYGSQYVVNNSFIKIDKSIVNSKVLMVKHAYVVKDFFDENGNTLTYDAFITKFDITHNFPFTLFYGILAAIPREWKAHIEHLENPSENVLRLISFTTNGRPTKFVYNHFVNLKVSTPRAVFKWEEISNFNGNWHRVFLLPYAAVRDTKVQYFHLRFIHRIIGTNFFLHKIKVKDSPLCTFCNSESETLEHLFWSCRVSQLFWRSISVLCLKQDFSITLDHVNFGLLEDIKCPLNFFILNAKYFLFNCKLNNKLPEAHTFYCKFRFLLDVEYYILRKQNNDLRTLRFQEIFKTTG